MTIYFSEKLRFHRKPESFERVRANHAKNDVQKGCAVQLNGIKPARAAKANN